MSNTPTLELPVARSAAHQKALAKLFQRIGELSSLPTLTTRLLAIADEQDIENELLVIVSSDPVAVARMLRRVNAGYPELPGPITEISEAICLLGTQEVWNIALTASLARLFSASDSVVPISGYNREQLWHYSVAIAKAAAIIATHSKQDSPLMAYTAGMLHHIGYYLLDQHLKNHYLRFVALAKHRAKGPLEITELEEALFTFNHATLGGFAAAKWNLPRSVCDAIECHHHLKRYRGEHRSLVATLVLAGSLCAEAGWMPLGLPCPLQKLDPLLSMVRLPIHGDVALRREIAAAIGPVAADPLAAAKPVLQA